jgi:DNA-binding CsgD family transcriptional regulator
MEVVVEGATGIVAGIVGRESELEVLRGFFGADGSGRALVLSGGAGIGKTTLWEAGVELARERGSRTLVARPSGTEASLSFAALIDLLEGVDAGAWMSVPAPQRSALEVALLRAEPSGVPPEPHAIALGVLNVLRALAAEGPVLLAVDDIPWLDAPSADALVFAARRLKDEPVTFLLARRPGRRSVLERALEPRGLERLEVGPLGFAASRRLLSDRLGLVVSRQVLRRIVDSTLGNPLFVLEVGRALLEQGVPAFGEDFPVPDAVEGMLGIRVAGLAPALRRLLLAVGLSADPRVDELIAVAGEAAVDEAVEAGLLRVDGRRARAAHPLVAAAAKQQAGPRERRELHRALAAAVSDRELHALHMALATSRPDAALAATVAAAAGEASARGARQEAAMLAEHALRLTDDDAPERGDRVLALARYLVIVGEGQRLRDLLMPEVASIPSGVARARLHLMMAEASNSAIDYDRYLDLALAECEGDAEVRARAVAGKTTNTAAATVARLPEAEASAVAELHAARRAGPEVERQLLYGLSWARIMRGRAIDDLCARFQEVSDEPFFIVQSPIRVAAQRLIWRGEVHDARRELLRLAALAEEQGEPASDAIVRFHRCELALRAGEFDAAQRLLDEWAESDVAELLPFPMYERCRAVLAAGRGLPGETARWVARAIERSDETGAHIDRLEALRARGTAALLAQNPDQARDSLGAVWDHCCREGVEEPGAFPVAGELVEALGALGEAENARAVVLRLRDLSEQQQHPWGLATARRSEALLQLLIGPYDERAALALAGAAENFARLGLRFDCARSLLSLGRAQRRFKKWGPAREALKGAIAVFEDLGSSGWAQRARSQLDRVGARRPRASGELTASEREIVELAARGRTNKEIAQALSLAVHTVEVHLSRAYARLGVRSRSELASRLNIRS